MEVLNGKAEMVTYRGRRALYLVHSPNHEADDTIIATPTDQTSATAHFKYSFTNQFVPIMSAKCCRISLRSTYLGSSLAATTSTRQADLYTAR
jgi:hypothetical protein